MTSPLRAVVLHIESSGEGPSVVLAHGFAGSARNFRPQAKALAEAHEIVTYDARGHARSGAPSEPEAYDFERLIDDYEWVVGDRAEPVVASGLSLGAATALGFALRRPERVRALILASPPGGSDDPERRAWALGFAHAIEHKGLEAAGAEFVWGERARFDPRGAALIRAGFMEHPPHALAHILRRSLAELPGPSRLAAELARFSRPVLVVTGSEDGSSKESSRALVGLLPQAELAEIAGAGHVVNLAAPQAFNEACRNFLERVDRSGAPSTAR
jgi:2-succinyl-6-hydroxy-2,4-cyclohexadiene-1-carboxylate synthase